jgi:hypothetical protein
MGRPLSVFTLSDAQEQTLRSLARRRTTAQALALRARIVLACAVGDPKPGRCGEARSDAANGLQMASALRRAAVGWPA